MRHVWACLLAVGLLACKGESKPAPPPATVQVEITPFLVERYLVYRSALNDALEQDLESYRQGQLDGGWDALRGLLKERQTLGLREHQLSTEEARQLQKMVQETVFVRQPFKDAAPGSHSAQEIEAGLQLPQARAKYGDAAVDAVLGREDLLYLEEQRSHALLMSARP